MAKHPIQKVIVDDSGVWRFTQNDIVQFMLDKLKTFNYDLNDLHSDCHDKDKEDWDQFNQLIGYSVSGAPISDTVRTVAYHMFEKESSEEESRITVLEGQLEYTKKHIGYVAAELFRMAPEDFGLDYEE